MRVASAATASGTFWCCAASSSRVARSGGRCGVSHGATSNQSACHGLERCKHAGQWAGKIRQGVGQHAMAVGGVSVEVAVGADDELIDLRRQRGERPFDQWTALVFDQAFIDSAHAPPEAAGQNDGGDARSLQCRAYR